MEKLNEKIDKYFGIKKEQDVSDFMLYHRADNNVGYNVYYKNNGDYKVYNMNDVVNKLHEYNQGVELLGKYGFKRGFEQLSEYCDVFGEDNKKYHYNCISRLVNLEEDLW